MRCKKGKLNWFKRVGQLCIITTIIVGLFQAATPTNDTIAGTSATGNDPIGIKYDGNGAPETSHAWQPENQTNVLNPLGGDNGTNAQQFSVQGPTTSDGYENMPLTATGVPKNENRALLSFTNSSFTDVSNPAFRISKYATQTNTPGRFNVSLTVQGNKPSDQQPAPLDIVFVIDRSGSMQRNHNRAGQLQDGLEKTMDQLVREQESGKLKGKLQLGLVGFSNPDNYFSWQIGRRMAGDRAYVPLTPVADPNTIGIGNAQPMRDMENEIKREDGPNDNGSTWTQDGLYRGAAMLKSDQTENAKKVLVLLTDGDPTFAVDTNAYPNPVDPSHAPDVSRLKVFGDGVADHRQPPKVWYYTSQAATKVKDEHIHIQGIGIEIGDEAQVGARYHFSDWTSKKLDGSGADYQSVDADKLPETILQNVDGILTDYSFPETISNGTVEDPLGEQYQYVNDEKPSVTGTNLTDDQLNQIESHVNLSDKDLTLSNLSLGKNQKVTLTYQVALKTEDDKFQPNTWYPMNGETTLTPSSDMPKVDFGIPSGRAPGASITVEKKWQDLEGEGTNKRPSSIEFTVTRSIKGQPTNWTATGTLTAANKWKGTFDQLNHNGTLVKLPQFDNNGQPFTYTVSKETQSDDLRNGGYSLVSIQHSSDSSGTPSNILTNQQYLLNVKKMAFGADIQTDALKGAEFTVTSDQGQPQKTQLIKDDNPYAYLQLGETYHVQETVAPKNYKLDETSYTFTLNKDGQFKVNDQTPDSLPKQGSAQDGFYLTNPASSNAKILTLVKTDKPSVPPTTITINKTDANTGNPLKGAAFSLSGDVKVTPNSEGTSFTTSPLALGKSYNLSESAVPGGYQGLQTPIVVDVKDDGAVTVALGPTGKPVTVPTDGTTVDLTPDVKAQIVMTGTNDTPTRQIVLTIANHKKGILPHTGSGGPLQALMLSVALTLTAVLLFGVAWLQKREEEA